ncbi:transposase [Streptosporangium sp. H16]|uniref:transposase n=1 Tax=Streptosporangium sp. H16 TaxID=3444184 RepID=UPI003F78B188
MDLTAQQWALIGHLLPAPHWDGRPDKHPRRKVVDAIMYVARTRCAWRQLRAVGVGRPRRRGDRGPRLV